MGRRAALRVPSWGRLGVRVVEPLLTTIMPMAASLLTGPGAGRLAASTFTTAMSVAGSVPISLKWPYLEEPIRTTRFWW